MDAFFLFMHLWPKFMFQAIVNEFVYKLPPIKPFRKWISPLPSFIYLSDPLKVQNRFSELSHVLNKIAKEMKAGKSYALSPSGCLKHTGKECLGGNLAAHYLLQECPDVNVVLVRVSGFWGSSFSRAATGDSPDLAKTLLQGGKMLLKNSIFFMPKRPVLMQIEANPQDFPRYASKQKLNQYLEDWYNRYPDKTAQTVPSEPLTQVPYYFWKNSKI
jgi:long-chain-fatty-acid--[acyl-carrier-protein] ligase